MAEIQLPAGYSFLEGDEVRRFLEGIPQPVTGREVGLVVRSGAGWYIIFTFDEIGWVPESEQDRLDPEGLLVAIRQVTAVVNRERSRQGWTPVQILGWATAPHYDGKLHRLEWSTDETSSGRSLLEVNARYLGRRGVMRATLVADPTQFSRTLPEYRRVMEGFSWVPGQRYEDRQPGDRQAPNGLTALVVGGAGAVAVKVGAVRWKWWVLVLIAIAGGLALLRFDPRRSPTPTRPTGRPIHRRRG